MHFVRLAGVGICGLIYLGFVEVLDSLWFEFVEPFGFEFNLWMDFF